MALNLLKSLRRIFPPYFSPLHATEIKRFNLDGKACSPAFTLYLIHQSLHFSFYWMKNWIVGKKQKHAGALVQSWATNVSHSTISSHLISSHHPPTRWSALYLFPMLPRLVTHLSHSLFLLLPVWLWVKYFYLWSSFTAGLTRHNSKLAPFLFISLSFWFHQYLLSDSFQVSL